MVNLFRHAERRPAAAAVLNVLRQKCEHKGIAVPTFESLLPHRQILDVTWPQMLGHQLPVLPPLEEFWNALPEIFTWLMGDGFGVTTDISYDAALRPSQVTSNFSDSNHPSPLWTANAANAYNALGLTQATLGNGITENIGYDNRGRKASDSFTNPVNSQNVYSYSLGYFPNSNIQSANDTANGNWTYTYDNLSRLLTASASSGPWASDTLQWGMDAWGNLNSQTLTAGSVPVPQPSLSSNSNNQIAGYCYDQAGNLVDEGNCRLIGPQQFTYDGAGRMTSPDYGNTTYVYDASGQRVAKQSNGISNYEYLYDLSGNQITEIAAQTSYLWNRGEVYVGSRHIATYIGGTTYFAHTDWLGNERVHSKMDASIQESCANLPYGDDLTCASGVNPFHFTGKERDSESGNDYFGARYYSSNMGRWLNPDEPFADQHAESPQSWNLYAYGLNNPLVFFDSNGKAVWAAEPIVIGNEGELYWSPTGQMIDPSAMIATLHPSLSYRDPAYVQRDQASHLNVPQESGGGCIFGCASTYSSEAVGYNLEISFSYDKKNNATAAFFSWSLDKNAVFIGANPPGTTSSFGPIPDLGGLPPPPTVLYVNIDPKALNGLSDDQLAALQSATLNKLRPGRLQTALIAAIAQEVKSRQRNKTCTRRGAITNRNDQ